MPAISVLLPVYNTDPEHLKQAIDSVLVQSFADFELLICNDNSSFSHVEDIVLSFSDPRIRYMCSDVSLGISGVRNLLLDEAKGKYIAVMDHDDIALPERFSKQFSVMEANADIGICGTGQKRFGRLFKNNIIRNPEHDEDIRAAMFFKCVIHHPSAMIRKSVLDDHNIRYDSSFVSGNDCILYRDISEHAKLYNLQDVLCLYRIHGGMTSRTKRQAIAQEQTRIRESYLQKINADLSVQQLEVLNGYVTRGRCRIKDKKTLVAVESVLTCLCDAVRRSQYLPVPQFEKICAKYLVKRSFNAMMCGRINSADILKNTSLPVMDVRIPAVLRLFNTFTRMFS